MSSSTQQPLQILPTLPAQPFCLDVEQADSLVRRWLDVDIAAAQHRQKYVPIFRKVLPGKKSATFFQLDRRFSMMIDVQLTSQLPLVQSPD